jgi:hypothetical protein
MMRNRILRIVLVLLAIAAQTGAAYQLVQMERRTESLLAAQGVFDDQTQALLADVSEIRTAQATYVAAGQGEAFWTARVTTLTEALRQNLSELRPAAATPEAARALASAAEAVESFASVDGKVRQYLQTEQRLLASDLIFADGLDLTATLREQIQTARRREGEWRESEARRLRQQAAYYLGGAAGATLLVLLLLLPTGKSRTTEAPGSAPAEEPKPPVRPGMLGLDGSPAVTPAQAAAMPPPATAAGAADLAAAAKLCTDLGRIAQPQELPTLLSRAAEILDASGIIIWLADSSTGELRAALSHGYPPQTLSRLKGVPRDADNAAASSYRTGELRTVQGDESRSGAVVAPLVTATACVGVLAAEIRHGGETSASVQAIATILAAQLATLVPAGPGPAAFGTQPPPATG